VIDILLKGSNEVKVGKDVLRFVRGVFGSFGCTVNKLAWVDVRTALV
jgi:hypothetical protein